MEEDEFIDGNSNYNVFTSQNRDFYIVALGGSAGAYESIEKFLKVIPYNSGIAFIVIQHLDPEHVSILHDLLQRSTTMEVLKVEDGMKVHPNKVYVIPENREMAIIKSTLLLYQNSKPRGKQMAIDIFLKAWLWTGVIKQHVLFFQA